MKFGIFLSDADVLDGSIKASVEAAVSYEKVDSILSRSTIIFTRRLVTQNQIN